MVHLTDTEPQMPATTWEMLSIRQQSIFREIVEAGLDSLVLPYAQSLPEMSDFLDTYELAEIRQEIEV